MFKRTIGVETKLGSIVQTSAGLRQRNCKFAKRYIISKYLDNSISRWEPHFLILNPVAPTWNRTPKTTWLVLGPPCRRLLRSAGDTGVLFFLRGRIPPRTLTGEHGE